MALMHTPEPNKGWKAPQFSALKGTDGKEYSFADIKGENGTLVMFICNHCPYVKGILDRFMTTMQQVQGLGIGVIAICSNDAEKYPDDSFEKMQEFAAENDFTFVYAQDEDQSVAQAYGAVCTPDYFGFNADDELEYRGRLDSSGKELANADTVPELLKAMELIAETGEGPATQHPSMGCSIKWKEANAA